jgi:predicted DNA-binding transcriptional regulator YafY
MRASRLLHLLLLLQNRGRLTCATLARELEVTRRTVLRDVDALTEAGLPIVVLRGKDGGVELGFNYRTRLTGLSADEAEALAVILAQPVPELDQLGMREPARRAVAKLVEAFPDTVRQHLEKARRAFVFPNEPKSDVDPRVAALVAAIKAKSIVHVNAHTNKARAIHPVGLELRDGGWHILDFRSDVPPLNLADAGNLNISAKKF